MPIKLIPMLVLLAASCLEQSVALTQSSSGGATAEVKVSSKAFDSSADVALQAMKSKAEELRIRGAAVLAYFD